ncbi:MAG: hypothetical protein EZS28_044301, partial [Streblomastix strix]
GQLIGICGDGANDCGALKTAHVVISLSEVESSTATTFTSKEATVEAVEAVLLKRRAALASSFHSFRKITVISMIRFISDQLLIFYDSKSLLYISWWDVDFDNEEDDEVIIV